MGVKGGKLAGGEAAAKGAGWGPWWAWWCDGVLYLGACRGAGWVPWLGVGWLSRVGSIEAFLTGGVCGVPAIAPA